MLRLLGRWSALSLVLSTMLSPQRILLENTTLRCNELRSDAINTVPTGCKVLLTRYFFPALFFALVAINPPMTTRIQMTKRIGTNWLGSGGWRLIWNTECPA